MTASTKHLQVRGSAPARRSPLDGRQGPHKIPQSFENEKLVTGRYNSSIAGSQKGEEGVKEPVEEKEVSRKGAKYAKAAKEGSDFRLVFPCALVLLCGMSCFDFSTPSKPIRKSGGRAAPD
jgi:hypothetical protein